MLASPGPSMTLEANLHTSTRPSRHTLTLTWLVLTSCRTSKSRTTPPGRPRQVHYPILCVVFTGCAGSRVPAMGARRGNLTRIPLVSHSTNLNPREEKCERYAAHLSNNFIYYFFPIFIISLVGVVMMEAFTLGGKSYTSTKTSQSCLFVPMDGISYFTSIKLEMLLVSAICFTSSLPLLLLP